ncbi:MAG: thiamine pyrophosphate-requiring protein [Dehalococcoidia bacterium]|nr:thiamine pyrophosphate-requiring protein [Dehalococcoidia bacterium]
MKGVTAIANVLKMEGVEYLFCFPNNPIIEAAAVAGIRPILARTERGAVNMADGYTRMAGGGKVGVVATQYGPGIENAFGAVAHAYADSIPILLLPTGTERGRTGVRPTFSAVLNYQGVTKWVEELNMARRIPEMMRHAFTNLRTGRTGPVMIEVPTDVAGEEIDEADFYYRPVKGYRSAGDPQDVAAAVRLLLAAKAPVLHVGQGVLDSEAWSELREFADLVQAPVMTITTGKSAFPEDHPLSIGNGGSTATGMVGHFLRKADLVFGIGSSFYESLMVTPIPSGKVMVQCTADERDLNNEHALDCAVLGDVKLVLQQLIEEAKRQAGPRGRPKNEALAREVRTAKEEWLRQWMPKLTSAEVPINPYRLIWDLMHTVDRAKTIVTHDSGNPRDQMTPFYEATAPKGYIGWGNSTQLGYSLGISIGAKLAAPEKTVVHLMGDAAIGMVGLDLESAVRAQAPIITIVLNNGLMGGYYQRMPAASDRYSTNKLGGNYTKLGESLGLHSERVERPADIVPAIRRAIAANQQGQSALLEVMTREEPAFSRVDWSSHG